MSSLLPVVVPQENPNDETAVLVRWHVESGRPIANGQVVATLETTKAAFDVYAPGDGFAFFDLPPGAIVNVGCTIAWISREPTVPQLPTSPEAGVEPDKSGAGEQRASRKALRLMRGHGLVVADFGVLARIEVADVERVLQQRSSVDPARVPNDAEPLEQSAAKIIEGRMLSEVYRQAVPSMVCIVMSSANVVERLRRTALESGPVSLLECAVHEVAGLLAEYPELNGYFADGRAWRYKAVSVGFAINAGHSLRVPVVHRAADLTQQGVAAVVRDLSLKYMRDELRMEDLIGGTITVTDLSSYDVVHFLPVINQRQAAILGLCAERPGSGQQELVLTFDHRMTDGMRAAEFLSNLRARLEGEARD